MKNNQDNKWKKVGYLHYWGQSPLNGEKLAKMVKKYRYLTLKDGKFHVGRPKDLEKAKVKKYERK